MNIVSHYRILFNFANRGNKGFYEAREFLAEVFINELESFIDLNGKKFLDIGGERGEFCKILTEKKQCQAINLEPQTLDFVFPTIQGRAEKLPFNNKEFDLVLMRGVIQHIHTKDKLKSLQEMHRVLKNEGIAYVMIPPWYSPLAGDVLKPFQIFGFPLAKHFSNTMMGRKITAKNLAELGIWPMTVRSTERYVKRAEFKILKTTDILGRMNFFTKIPVMRELLPSFGFILKKM